jgi:hypothetical protein
MKTQINKSEVFKSAWKLAKETAIGFGEALKKAWQFFKNQSKIALAFATQFFEITFVKANGETTTRQASNAKKADNDTNLLFFSISDNSFRKATLANILDIKPLAGTLALI